MSHLPPRPQPPAPTLVSRVATPLVAQVFVLSLLLAAAGFLLHDLYSVIDEARVMYSGLMNGLTLVGRLQYEAQETRRAMLYALTTSDAELQVKYADESVKADDRINRILAFNNDLNRSDAEQAAFTNLVVHWKAYLAQRDAVKASILEGDTKKALALDLSEGVVAFNRLRQDLEAMQAAFGARGQSQLDEANRLFHRSLWKLCLILLGTLLGTVTAAGWLQQRRALYTVKASETRLREVIGSINEGMIVLRDGDRIDLWNVAAAKLLGRRADQAVGKPLFDVLPDWRRTELGSLLEGQKDFVIRDLKVQARDEERCLQMRGFPFDTGVTLFFEDVTERRKAEDEVSRLNRELLESSRLAGMAEVATGVLHNVGNVLNSVNVSAALVVDQLRKTKMGTLANVVNLLKENKAELGHFITEDPKGKLIPALLEALYEHLAHEQTVLGRETLSLQQNVDHIKEIVAMQQSFAKVSGALETLPPEELVEDALRMSLVSLKRHEVQVVRQFQTVPLVLVDRHKVLQILVNLVSNAKQALMARPVGRRLVVSVNLSQEDDNRVRIEVSDNGSGIPTANLTRIFQHGFTTKKDGHGFGLHSAANSAKELGGSLNAFSAGPGQGASFVLELPISRTPAQSGSAGDQETQRSGRREAA